MSVADFPDFSKGVLILVGSNVSTADTADWTVPVYVTGSSPQEQVNTVTASGATQTLPDVTTATIDHITLTANCTLTFMGAAAGKSFLLVLKQDATGGRTVTWPGTVLWAAGTAPTLTVTAGKSDMFSFVCVDGTNWVGVTASQNF